jgi:transcriptional regulator with XRE-family HTH domain
MEQARLVQYGAAIRSLRTALGVSQQQLARRIGRSQAFVSLVERGRYRSLTVADGDRLCRALGGTLVLGVEAPLVLGGGRQRDAAHARCLGHVARRLTAAGWLVEREVEVGDPRRPGWIDVLAFHPGANIVLVIEVKTELRDLGELERQIGWYEREARSASRRLGWYPDLAVGCVLLLATEANERRLRENGLSLAAAFPLRGPALWELVSGRRPVTDVGGRGLAMIDPRSRRRRWCQPTVFDGRRPSAPYRNYADFIRASTPRSSRQLAPARAPVGRADHQR